MFENVALTQNALGKLTANLEALTKDVDRLSKKVSHFEERIGGKVGEVKKQTLRLNTTLKTTLSVLAVVVPLFAGFLWWAIGDRIDVTLRSSPPRAGLSPSATKPP